MLKQRVLTALVLAPLVIWGIFALPELGFKLFLAFIVALASWEWSRFAGLNAYMYRIIYSGIILLVTFVLDKYVEMHDQTAIRIIAGIFMLWWVIVLLRLATYRVRNLVTEIKIFSTVLAGIPVITGAYFSLVLLRRDFGAESIMILFLLVWGADTAAYFTGKKFGKNKLLPEISPGKTLEGVAGALIITFITGIITSLWFNFGGLAIAEYVMVCLVVVIFSIVGDLNESLYKRRARIKDSSNILPGHGGVLDRIDSLTAAAPVFLYGLWILQV